MYFGVLLSYKIERPIIQGFEADSEFSINAVHPSPWSLEDFKVHIDAEKLKYLSSEKAGTLKRLGLIDENIADLEKIIAAKMLSNYIYNMTYDSEHDTTKFDIVLEVHPADSAPPVRVLVALEYMPEQKRLRLITLH